MPTAYEGHEPYLFVSYSHRDAATVFPLLEALQAQGFRLWYDAVKSTDLAVLAERLKGAACVLFFASQAASESRFCQQEMAYAVEQRKELLVVHLEKQTLPLGMQMMMSACQSLCLWQYPTEKEFIERLVSAKVLEAARSAENKEPPAMPVAYEGDEPYAFISYAHRDATAVMPVIGTLGRRGYRVWYDAGVEAGTDWSETVAQRLNGCTTLIFFLSDHSIGSKNCRNELNFALALGKAVLVIEVSSVMTVPVGMQLQLAKLERLSLSHGGTAEVLADKLAESASLASCRTTGGRLPSMPMPPSAEPSVSKAPSRSVPPVSEATDGYDVFISYKSDDEAMASTLFRFLVSHGKRVFFSRESLPLLGSSEYEDRIFEALDGAKHMVLIGSDPAYFKTEWVMDEWKTFNNEKREGRKSGNLVIVLADAVARDKGRLPLQLRNTTIVRWGEVETDLLPYLP